MRHSTPHILSGLLSQTMVDDLCQGLLRAAEVEVREAGLMDLSQGIDGLNGVSDAPAASGGGAGKRSREAATEEDSAGAEQRRKKRARSSESVSAII